MSHSLRSKIKCLRYKGIITDKDCDRLRKALDNEDVLDKIRAEIADLEIIDYDYEGYYQEGYCKAITDVSQIIDKYRKGQE